MSKYAGTMTSKSIRISGPGVVKLAVQLNGQNPYLGTFSQTQSLVDFIVELCDYWKLECPTNYALQFTEAPKHYVTENKRARITNGTVLQLLPSAALVTDDILKKLKDDNLEDKIIALNKLAEMASDITFAEEFHGKQGMLLLLSFVEESSAEKIAQLLSSFSAFLDLMDHGIFPWDRVNNHFISKVVSIVSSHLPEHAKLVALALSILENIVLNSQENYSKVSDQITLPNLFYHITNSKIQLLIM